MFELLPTEKNYVYDCYVILQHLNKQMLEKKFVGSAKYVLNDIVNEFQICPCNAKFYLMRQKSQYVSITLPINHNEGWFNLKF